MNNISYRQRITKKIERGFKDAVMLVGVECTKVISQPRFWEGYDVRDIVDTGQLRAAQQIRFQTSGDIMEAEIQYNVEYAAPVHNGAVIKYRNGNIRRIPKRPWIPIAVERVNFPVTLKKLTT